MVKTVKRNAELAARVQKVHELTGVSKKQIRRIISGTCKNDGVMELYMFLYQGENGLMQQAREIVKFS